MHQDYHDYNNDEIDYDDTTPFVTTDASTTMSLKYKTPASCCTQDSSYKNNTCDNYYQEGCTMHVTDFISETMLIVATLLLAIGVLQVRYRVLFCANICNVFHQYICYHFQILGMVASFMLARMFRRASAYQNIEKFKSQYKNIFDVPTNVDYRPLNNSSDA